MSEDVPVAGRLPLLVDGSVERAVAEAGLVAGGGTLAVHTASAELPRSLRSSGLRPSSPPWPIAPRPERRGFTVHPRRRSPISRSCPGSHVELDAVWCGPFRELQLPRTPVIAEGKDGQHARVKRGRAAHVGCRALSPQDGTFTFMFLSPLRVGVPCSAGARNPEWPEDDLAQCRTALPGSATA